MPRSRWVSCGSAPSSFAGALGRDDRTFHVGIARRHQARVRQVARAAWRYQRAPAVTTRHARCSRRDSFDSLDSVAFPRRGAACHLRMAHPGGRPLRSSASRTRWSVDWRLAALLGQEHRHRCGHLPAHCWMPRMPMSAAFPAGRFSQSVGHVGRIRLSARITVSRGLVYYRHIGSGGEGCSEFAHVCGHVAGTRQHLATAPAEMSVGSARKAT